MREMKITINCNYSRTQRIAQENVYVRNSNETIYYYNKNKCPENAKTLKFCKSDSVRNTQENVGLLQL